MERQTEATEIAANAANKNIEMLINKERARLRIEPSRLVLQSVAIAHTVNFKILFYGLSNAFIDRVGVRAVVSDSPEPPTTDYFWPMSLPDVIKPDTVIPDQMAFLGVSLKITEGQIDKITQGQSAVHFWGYIHYHDVFGIERVTTFRYRWWNQINLLGELPRNGAWNKCGTPEDNQET